MDNPGYYDEKPPSSPANGPSSQGNNSNDVKLEMTKVPSDLKISDKDSRNLPRYHDSQSNVDLTTETRRKSTYERVVYRAQASVHGFFIGDEKRTNVLIWILAAVLSVGWVVYLGFAIAHNVDTALPMIIITGFVIFCITYYLIKRYFGDRIYNGCLKPIGAALSKYSRYLKWVFYALVLIALALILYFVVGRDKPQYLISLVGTGSILLICFLTSTNPAQVKWRPVLWGIALQFIFGLLVLRWQPGYEAFKWLAEQIKVFLAYANTGSAFVFGELYINHPFVFEAIPQAIFFSAIISILYHFGVIQEIVLKLGWLMEVTLGTTAVESLNATANIFISSVEAAVIIRHWLPNLTYSELHAVMCGGFATVAGVVMAVFISFGAPAEHVLSAAIMSAPAALALGKLSVPETEVSVTKADEIKLEPPSSRNFFEAAANGAVATIKLIGHVVVNLIAFIGLLSFVNAVLWYLGMAVGFSEPGGLTFAWICSKVLKPLAFVLGVSWEDAEIIGELIGTKIFVNEFIAYATMNQYYLANKISDRSRAICTYTLCGFGSVGDIGINVGVFGAFAPSRRTELSEMALRALVMGNVAGFLTAAIAGLLYSGNDLYYNELMQLNTTTIASVP